MTHANSLPEDSEEIVKFPREDFRAETPARRAQWAADALNPALWPGDETPSMEQCLLAFPELTPKKKKERFSSFDKTSIAADKYGCYAAIFTHAPGFWISLNVMENADAVSVNHQETAFFYSGRFPWELAVRLRAGREANGLDGPSPLNPWLARAAASAAESLPDDPAAQAFARATAQEGHKIGWGRSTGWTPEGDATLGGNPMWGVLDINVWLWDFFPNGQERSERREMLPEEEAAFFFKAADRFSRNFAALLEQEPFWSAGPAFFATSHRACRYRDGNDDFPVCLLRTTEAWAAAEAQEIAKGLPENASVGSSLSEPGAAPRPRNRL